MLVCSTRVHVAGALASALEIWQALPLMGCTEQGISLNRAHRDVAYASD